MFKTAFRGWAPDVNVTNYVTVEDAKSMGVPAKILDLFAKHSSRNPKIGFNINTNLWYVEFDSNKGRIKSWV